MYNINLELEIFLDFDRQRILIRKGRRERQYMERRKVGCTKVWGSVGRLNRGVEGSEGPHEGSTWRERSRCAPSPRTIAHIHTNIYGSQQHRSNSLPSTFCFSSFPSFSLLVSRFMYMFTLEYTYASTYGFAGRKRKNARVHSRARMRAC